MRLKHMCEGRKAALGKSSCWRRIHKTDFFTADPVELRAAHNRHITSRILGVGIAIESGSVLTRRGRNAFHNLDRSRQACLRCVGMPLKTLQSEIVSVSNKRTVFNTDTSVRGGTFRPTHRWTWSIPAWIRTTNLTDSRSLA